MPDGRDDPRMSINELGKYLVSSPVQRRRIVRQQKYPATYMVNWYEFARTAIDRFVLGGMTNEEILLREIDRLYELTPANDYEQTRARTNAEALESFLGSYDQFDFGPLTVTEGDADPPKLTLAGVEISVRPEYLLSGQHRGRDCVGAVKLYFSKPEPLSGESAAYVSAIVARYAQEHLCPPGQSVRNPLCQVFDVFAGQVHSAPQAITRRFQDIEAACQEIGLLWPTV